jgi:hypothetical protein
MQDQIQVKINEVKTLQSLNDQLNLEVGKIKGMLAKEKEKSEDISTDLEIANTELSVRNW